MGKLDKMLVANCMANWETRLLTNSFIVKFRKNSNQLVVSKSRFLTMRKIIEFKPESIDFEMKYKDYNYVIFVEKTPVLKTITYFWYIQLKEDLSKLLLNNYELDIKDCDIHHVLKDSDRDLVWIGFDSNRVYCLKEEEKFSLDYFKEVAQAIIDNIISGKYTTEKCHE